MATWGEVMREVHDAMNLMRWWLNEMRYDEGWPGWKTWEEGGDELDW